jgi:hypothetical protein
MTGEFSKGYLRVSRIGVELIKSELMGMSRVLRLERNFV